MIYQWENDSCPIRETISTNSNQWKNACFSGNGVMNYPTEKKSISFQNNSTDQIKENLQKIEISFFHGEKWQKWLDG